MQQENLRRYTRVNSTTSILDDPDYLGTSIETPLKASKNTLSKQEKNYNAPHCASSEIEDI